jgi:hypothetical protein
MTCSNTYKKAPTRENRSGLFVLYIVLYEKPLDDAMQSSDAF